MHDPERQVDGPDIPKMAPEQHDAADGVANDVDGGLEKRFALTVE